MLASCDTDAHTRSLKKTFWITSGVKIFDQLIIHQILEWRSQLADMSAVPDTVKLMQRRHSTRVCGHIQKHAVTKYMWVHYSSLPWGYDQATLIRISDCGCTVTAVKWQPHKLRGSRKTRACTLNPQCPVHGRFQQSAFTGCAASWHWSRCSSREWLMMA